MYELVFILLKHAVLINEVMSESFLNYMILHTLSSALK